ncbi:MAG: hypothetical protein HY903_15090 [Deltaproteobacteria bacterium]|nr:hypothetical protein [Deltaproteobacteria bacterium]
MATQSHSRRAPDILLERYLAGDLPAAMAEEVAKLIALSDATRARLRELESERAAFLAANPAAPFAHQLATRLAVDGGAGPRRRPWWAWALAPALTAAATAVVVLAVVRQVPDVARPLASVPAQDLALLAPEESATPAPATSSRFATPPPPTAAPEAEAVRQAAAEPAGGAKPQPKKDAPVPGRARSKARAAPDPGKGGAAGGGGLGGLGDRDERKKAKEEGQKTSAPAASKRDDAMAAPAVPIQVADQPAVATPPPPPAPVAESRPTRAPVAIEREIAAPASSPGAAASVGAAAADVSAPPADDSGAGITAVEAAKGRKASAPVRPEVLAAVRRHAAALALCLRPAFAAGELGSGKYTLLLDFVIQPSGAVIKGRLRGPEALVASSARLCVVTAMRSWRLPPPDGDEVVTALPVTVAIP